MKVLFFEPIGGFWPYTPNLAKAVGKLSTKDRVTLLTSSAREAYKIEGVEIVTTCRKMNSQISRKQLLRWVVDRMTTSMQWLQIRGKLIKELKPDVLHIHFTATGFDQYILPRLSKKVKVVLTVHDVTPLVQTKMHSLKSIKKVYRSAAAMIVHSEANRVQLVEELGMDPNKVNVIPHVMDNLDGKNELASTEEAKVKLGLDQEKDYLLFFGRIRKSKGLELAIKAMFKLDSVASSMGKESVGEPIHLLVAGSPHWDVDMDSIRGMIKKYGIENKITLHIGFVADEDVDDYFAACKIVLLPYVAFYSQSGVLLQSYQYRRPVIVTDKGSLGETVRDDGTGYVVESLDPDLMANQILSLLSNERAYKICAANQGKAIEEKYNSSIIGVATRKLYQRVLSNK